MAGNLPHTMLDVPDSTDWLGTALACLMPVEQAFRCHVCKDFFSSPMLTSCNHTFCSICIRRCLATDGKCPLCRAPDFESKLRGNWALREAIEAFTKSRPTIIQFARAPQPLPGPTADSHKRKTNGVEAVQMEGQDGKRSRMSTRSSKTRAADRTAHVVQLEAAVSETKSRDCADNDPDDDLVSCPMCLTRMKVNQVDRHIDTSCPGSRQSQRASASSSSTSSAALPPPPPPQQPPERIPGIAYAILKDNALRKKMGELGLPTFGSRQDLERRHKEWVTMWNANGDAARPRKKAELLRDLDVWERTMGSRAPIRSVSATMGAQIKDKHFDGPAWMARHDNSFKELVASARRTKKLGEEKALDAGANDCRLKLCSTPNLARVNQILPSWVLRGRRSRPASAVWAGSLVINRVWMSNQDRLQIHILSLPTA